MRNILLGPRTISDINHQVDRIIKGLDNPDPPLKLEYVRELLKLDRQYYSGTDDSFVREVFSRMKIARKQVLLRPTILKDAIQSLSLKALYLPDSRRILIDEDVPRIKHRWNEAHEIGHGIIPWHEGILFGDDRQTLTPECHDLMEAEANYAAGQLLFLGHRFRDEALAAPASIALVTALAKRFGNTITTTLWRYVEEAEDGRPMVALVSGHPHSSRRKQDFDPATPCRYYIQSPLFKENFGKLSDIDLFAIVAGYAGAQRGGSLGQANIPLTDDEGGTHLFEFETFFNGYEALTLGVWKKQEPRLN